jgi:hypothetical protein
MFKKFAEKQQAKFIENAKAEVGIFLVEGEEIEQIFPLIEDYIVFTNDRVIFVDKQFTSSKKSISSVYFEKITSISLSKGGFMQIAKEIKIGVGSKGFDFKMYDENATVEVYKLLSKKLSKRA